MILDIHTQDVGYAMSSRKITAGKRIKPTNSGHSFLMCGTMFTEYDTKNEETTILANFLYH